jgi:hypothetical protein
MELSAFQVVLAGVPPLILVAVYLSAVIGIQARSDLRLIDPGSAVLVNESIGWIFRFFVPLSLALAPLSATGLLAEAEGVSLFLLLIFIPGLMLWSLAFWESKESARQRRAVLFVAIASFYPLFLIQSIYGSIYLHLAQDQILNFQSWVIAVSAVGIAGLAVWRYIGGPRAYIRRIEDAGKQKGRADEADRIVAEITNRISLSRQLAATSWSYFRGCRGWDKTDMKEGDRSKQLVKAIGHRPGLLSHVAIYVFLILGAFPRIILIIFAGIIDARYLNRALQKVLGEPFWRWGESLRGAEELTYQLDTQVWRSHPYVLFHKMDSLVRVRLLLDYLRHPDSNHRTRLLNYHELAVKHLRALLRIQRGRVETYKRLTKLFRDDQRLARSSAWNVKVVGISIHQIRMALHEIEKIALLLL